MAAAQSVPGQPTISFFSQSPTAWYSLTADQKASCTGAALQKQIEEHHAWPPDGELREGWNQAGLRTYHAVIKTGPRPDKISPPQLWLLSKLDQQETAVPHVVITCKDIKHGNNTIEHLKKNDQLTRFGLPYFPRKNKMKPYTHTTRDDDSDSSGENNAIFLCGARIAAYTGSARFSNPKRNTSTIGCVLQVGLKRYALTAAHVFFDGVDTTKSWHESKVSITSRSRQRIASIASDWSMDNIIEPRVSDAYDISVESLWPHKRELGDDIDTTSEMIGRVAPRVTQDRSNRGQPEVVLNNQLDWALIELPTTAALGPNSLAQEDGKRLNLVLPDLDDGSKSLPPSGEVSIMCGVSGQVSGRGLGTIGGILLPWRTEETEAWSIECDIAVGDSGSLAVNPQTGQIYGLVVTYDPDIMLTYIVPIHAIMRSIREQMKVNPSLIGQTPAQSAGESTASALSTAIDSVQSGEYTKRTSMDDDDPKRITMGRRESSLAEGTRVHEEFQLQLRKMTRRNTFGQSFIDTKALSEWMLRKIRREITNLDILLDLVYTTDLILPVRSEDITRPRTSFLRVFCLLLELGYGNLIHWCRRLNLQDNRMPYELSSIRTLLEHSESLGNDTDRITEQIFERQWAYSALWFDLDQSLLLDPRRVLPFIQRQRINAKGATAELHEVSVPESFVDHNLRRHIESARFDNRADSLGPRYSFAVKTFLRKDRNLFRAERDAFHLLKGNKNFIQCFGDFATGDGESQTFNLVLEYGDLDLAEHYALATTPVLLTDICDFWEKMSGVVAAIADLHNFCYSRVARTEVLIGSHHDIKPDNILLVNDKLKLADPGFALFNRTGSRLGKVRGGTITYGPPELAFGDLSDSSEEVGQSADIWSLGCVLSEAATWVILGKSGIDKYSSVRHKALREYEQATADENPSSGDSLRRIVYGDQFHDGRRVLNAVREWHNFLRASLRVTDSITSKIMDMIDGFMLVKAGHRIQADALLRKINSELQTVRRDASGNEFSFDSVLHSKPSDQPLIRTEPTQRSTRYLEKIPVIQDPSLEQEHRPPSPISVPRRYSPPLVYSLSRQDSMPLRTSSTTSVASLRRLSNTGLEPIRVLYETVETARAAINRDFGGSSLRRLLSGRSRHKSRKDVLLSRYFSDREIIFLVDNAEPMKQHWSELINVLEVLINKVKGQDDEGSDVYFTIGRASHHISSARSTSERKLPLLLNSKVARPLEGTATDMSDALAPLLSEYLGRVRKKGRGKGLSIIILTDGRWTGSSVSSEVAVTLLEFFKRLQALEPSTLNPSLKLGIEFVTFGDDPKAKARFEELDRMSLERGVPDIIDVEPSTGNVYKMLLGNFVEQYDYDESAEEMTLSL